MSAALLADQEMLYSIDGQGKLFTKIIDTLEKSEMMTTEDEEMLAKIKETLEMVKASKIQIVKTEVVLLKSMLSLSDVEYSHCYLTENNKAVEDTVLYFRNKAKLKSTFFGNISIFAINDTIKVSFEDDRDLIEFKMNMP